MARLADSEKTIWALRARVTELEEQYETLRKAAEYASGWLLAGNQRDQDVAAHLKAALDGSNPATEPSDG